MKRLLLCAAVMMVLCGCTAEVPAKETVNDTVDQTALCYAGGTEQFTIAVPETAQLLWQTDTESYYSIDDGAMDIWVVRTKNHDAISMVKVLTGMNPDINDVITSGGVCRYAWYAQSETGGRNCCAAIAIDGVDGFAVICTADETAGNRYDDLLRSITGSIMIEGLEEI